MSYCIEVDKIVFLDWHQCISDHCDLLWHHTFKPGY